MTKDSQTDELSLPDTSQETANWLRMLAREINTFVLFLQTWGAMGFTIDPEVVSSLLKLQSRVVDARSRISGIGVEETPEGLRETLADIASHEEEVYRKLTEEIRRFKEESEGIFPALQMNFDPCF